MEDTLLDQHPPGRTDFHNYISANDICDNVDNTNVPNDITENTDLIASIEPRLSFWPNNEDPWGEQTDPVPLARASSQPALHSSTRSLKMQSANTSVFPSGTTLNTTETEYTLDPSERNSQSQTPVLQPGSSITSLSTGIDTPVQAEFVGNDVVSFSDKELATAEKLFKTAITNYALESPNSKFKSNHCSRPELPLDTEEEELLQDLLRVPSKNNCKDAETQVEQGSAKHSDSVNDNLVTEIDMPLEFQRFLKHFFIAKADSDGPIYEKDWSVSDIGTIDNLDLLKVNPAFSQQNKKVQSLSQESDVFARIRSELGDIAFRAKESVIIESLKNPVSTTSVENTPAIETHEDFQTKLVKYCKKWH